MRGLIAKIEGKTISVCIGTVPPGAIAYSSPGTLTWNSNLGFYSGSLEEELFHHVQFDYYGGASMPHANAEFEAIIYRDIASNGLDGENNLDSDDKVRYESLINQLTNNRTTYPKSMADIFPDATHKAEFYSLMQKYSDAHGFGAVVNTLNPTVLIEVANAYNCPN